MHTTHLNHLLNVASYSQSKKRSGERIKSSRTNVCRVSDSALSFQITHTVAQIELLDSQLKQVKAEMTDTKKFNNTIIMIIPSIDYINGGMILSKIGNIQHFPTPNKMLAFTGHTPTVISTR